MPACARLIYAVRTYFMNLCVKRFDALVKNLCNAAATLASYLFGMFVTKRVASVYVGDQMNVACIAKLACILGVVLLVANYSIGKLYVRLGSDLKG